MHRTLAALAVALFLLSPLHGWNGKGHSVIGRMVWRELTEEERAKVTRILQRHPHYEEYLKDKAPTNIAEDEWVFLRAGTWPDWVRGGRGRGYHQPTWHYINLPLLAPGEGIRPPPLPRDNVVTQIATTRVILRGGNREEQAVHLCWLCHLIGDIHQPLHCTNYYSREFPTGDRGGNLALIRIEGRVVQLHSFWDGLLGTSITATSLNRSEQELLELLEEKRTEIEADLKARRTPRDWAREGQRLAWQLVYQEGKLKPRNSSSQPDPEELPDLPRSYAEEAGAAARLCVAKASLRLTADLREFLARIE